MALACHCVGKKSEHGHHFHLQNEWQYGNERARCTEMSVPDPSTEMSVPDPRCEKGTRGPLSMRFRAGESEISLLDRIPT